MAIQEIIIKGKKFRSINAACKFHRIKKSTYIGRRYRGWSIIKSITTKTIAKKDQEPSFVKEIKINGIYFKSVKVAAKHFDIPYEVFAHRVRKKFSKKRLLHKGKLESSIASKSIKVRISEAIEKLKILEKKEKINTLEDWYRIPLVKIGKIIANVSRKKSMTSFDFLTKIYPKKRLLPWKFVGKNKKAPDGTWQIKRIRVDYIKWLRKKLKINKLHGFYSVNYEIFYKNYGQGLTHSKDIKTGERFTILNLLKESYPNYDWKFWLFDHAPNDVWKDKKNQRALFDWILKKEKIKVNTNKIYNLTSSKFKKYKGSKTIMLYYKNFFECLEKLYPEIKFDRFKFFHKGRGFWEDKENHRVALLHLGEKLGFKKKKDWYAIQYDDFEKLGLSSLISQKGYNHSPAIVCQKNLIEHKFDMTKFDFSSKYEFRARCFAKCLFGSNNIIKNAKLNYLKYKQSGRKMELDIFIPRPGLKNNWKLAIEYNGSHHYFQKYQTKKEFEHRKALDVEKIEKCPKFKIKLIIIKYSKWDGLPDSFIKIMEKEIRVSKSKKKLFWTRFKNDDLYDDVIKETKKKNFN